MPSVCPHCSGVILSYADHAPLCWRLDPTVFSRWAVDLSIPPLELSPHERRHAVDLIASQMAPDDGSALSMLFTWGVGYWRNELADHLFVMPQLMTLHVTLTDIEIDSLEHLHDVAAVAVLRAAVLVDTVVADILTDLDPSGIELFGRAFYHQAQDEVSTRQDQDDEQDDEGDAHDALLPAFAAHEPQPLPPGTAHFGDTYSWVDGIQVTVSRPVRFSPSPHAAGGEAYPAHVRFTVAVTNETDSRFEPSSLSCEVMSGDREGDSIWSNDDGVGGSPSVGLLPGRTVRFDVAFGVHDPEDVILELRPDWDHDPVVFV